MADPQQFIFLALALLVSLTIHEAAHAFLAFSLGDTTAKSAGRLSLNPIRHLDPLGTIFLVFMAFSGQGIGWAKPVPVNPYNLRTNPKTGMAIVSFAGPLSNMVFAALAWLLISGDIVPNNLVFSFLRSLFLVNVSLAAFNLLPIPPLDGFKILLGFLPNSPAYALAKLERFGPMILLLLVIMLPSVLWKILNPIVGVIATIVTFGVV